MNDLSELKLPLGKNKLPSVLDIKYFQSRFDDYLNQDNVKITGANDLNKFARLFDEDKKKLSSSFKQITGMNLDWSWEAFHSHEPAGLHTDYHRKYYNNPNCHEGYDGNTITHYTDVKLGIIIPIKWNAPVTPYTITYDKVSHEPVKLMYTKNELRHFYDRDIVINYRNHDDRNIHTYTWPDSEIFKYHPPMSGYISQFASLNVHSAYEWEIGTMMLFDPARWHSSSWFLGGKALPESVESAIEYKQAIIGFGTVTTELGEKSYLPAQ